MRVAIFSRPGPCFPNVIAQGMVKSLKEIGVDATIFYESIPFLMRLLPFSKQPKRWHNNLQYRIRNKWGNFFKDQAFIKNINKYDAVMIAECYPNAFWKNYFALEELKRVFKGKLISYTESPLDAAPNNKQRLLDVDDYDEAIYDFNLFVTDLMETRVPIGEKQGVAGVNLAQNKLLTISKKRNFTALLDFAQPGYETYREQQVRVLTKLGIPFTELKGRYPIEEIRNLYAEAAIFFISFPETFGLPIAECLACGTKVFTPSSAWPMAWRLDQNPRPNQPGILPDCFAVYQNEAELTEMLVSAMNTYHALYSPKAVFDTFCKDYPAFYHGNKKALNEMVAKLS